MTTVPKILIIDSEKKETSNLLSHLDNKLDCDLVHIQSKKDLNGFNSKSSIDIALVDVTFHSTETGLELFKRFNTLANIITIGVIPEENPFLTTHVIQERPFFYISKPYNTVEVECILKRAIEKLDFNRSQQTLFESEDKFCGIIGKSAVMTKLFDLITKVAEDDISTVLIRGESGTGKELVAKAIHQKSSRNSRNFVPVNCAAIPDDLLESELFGHTKGAFTGATQAKQGRIQYADGGTLFLDEIGDMKPSLQAKLLRVLQEKEFEPVGGLQPTSVDTRILAATHCDLEQLVQEGTFREDLYYRLSVIPLQIPSLNDRREDIPHLIDEFIQTYTGKSGRDPFTFSASALNTLLRYNWKGNVRELENLIQHMSILYSGKTVNQQDLPEKFLSQENLCSEDLSYIDSSSQQADSTQEAPFSSFSPDAFLFGEQDIDFNKLINEFETTLIVSALKATEGNKKEAANLLNLKRTTLLEKIKKKNLDPSMWEE